jgi:hypothetical protein
MTKPLKDIVRRWPSQEARFWVESFAPCACANPHVLAVVLFGSAVRSSDYCADVDLLVIYDRQKPAVKGRPVDVDIRWHERLEADRLIAEGHELLGWVVRFGELVCEQNGYWTKLRDTWLNRMPFPSALVADERAERAERRYADLMKMGDFDAAHEQFLVALTQRARASLIRRRVFPASRPELPAQLRQIGDLVLSTKLEEAMRQREQA